MDIERIYTPPPFASIIHRINKLPQNKKEHLNRDALIKNWRRPTFPHMNRASGSVSRSPMNSSFSG